MLCSHWHRCNMSVGPQTDSARAVDEGCLWPLVQACVSTPKLLGTTPGSVWLSEVSEAQHKASLELRNGLPVHTMEQLTEKHIWGKFDLKATEREQCQGHRAVRSAACILALLAIAKGAALFGTSHKCTTCRWWCFIGLHNRSRGRNGLRSNVEGLHSED